MPEIDPTTIAFTPLPVPAAELGESPVWDAERQTLLWCDIPGGTIHEWDPAAETHRHWHLGGAVGSFGLCRSGRLIVGRNSEAGFFSRETGGFESFAKLGPEQPRRRANDGKIGPDGAFWISVMDATSARAAIGSLYRVTADGTVTSVMDGLIASNGLAWSADGRTMFHSDSRGLWLDRWVFDPATGAMSERTRIAVRDEASGRPDGGATDQEDTYWGAGVSAGRLNRYDRDGRLIAWVPTPVTAPTMPCFGGPDLRTLYVTSLDNGTPGAGRVLAGRAPAAGVPVPRFPD